MDQSDFIPLLVLLLSILLLTITSIIQNTYNLLSSVRLTNLASAGETKAQTILDTLENQNRVFISIKIIKTVLMVLIAFLYAHLLDFVSFNDFLAIVVVVFTIVIIEVLALAISKVNPDKTILKMSWVIKFLLLLSYPLYLISHLFLGLFSLFFKPEVENIMTEQELLNIIDEAEAEGGLAESEGDLIRRSIEFNDLIAEEILTPRVDLVALDKAWSLEKIESIIDENNYSRYPVYQDSIDTIIGVVHSKDFRLFDNEDYDLSRIVKPVIFVPESYKISKLLKQIQQNKSHLAVVIDEHGGTAGIITLEDIVEELVGEIWDEHDEEESELTKVNDEQFIILGSLELYKLEEALEIDLDSEQSDASTVGGWIVEHLGRIPQISQTLFFNNLKMTILDGDEKKVIKILVDKLEPQEENEDDQNDQDK